MDPVGGWPTFGSVTASTSVRGSRAAARRVARVTCPRSSSTISAAEAPDSSNRLYHATACPIQVFIVVEVLAHRVQAGMSAFRMTVPLQTASPSLQRSGRAAGLMQLDHDLRLQLVKLLGFQDRCAASAALRNNHCAEACKGMVCLSPWSTHDDRFGSVGCAWSASTARCVSGAQSTATSYGAMRSSASSRETTTTRHAGPEPNGCSVRSSTSVGLRC